LIYFPTPHISTHDMHRAANYFSVDL